MFECKSFQYAVIPAICLMFTSCGSDNELKNDFLEAQSVISNITKRIDECHTSEQCEQLEEELIKHSIPRLKDIQRNMYQQVFNNIQRKHGKLSESERLELLSTMANDARNSCEFASEFNAYRTSRNKLEAKTNTSQNAALQNALNEFECELEKFSTHAIIKEYRR